MTRRIQEESFLKSAEEIGLFGGEGNAKEDGGKLQSEGISILCY